MFPTVEVRWFYKGTIPPEIAAWFEHGEQMYDDLAPRTDQYLRLAGSDALSIKLREGRIEIKQRQRQYGAEHFHERVTGIVERWYKWSFILAGDNGAFEEKLLPAQSWIEVQKKRRLRRYNLADDRRLEALPVTTLPLQGCEFELTSLRAKGEEWWSLCFEAFGPEDTLHKSLALVAWHTMSSYPPPLLDADDSYSYPCWLEIVGQETGSIS
jgi:hypothetical protein